MNAELELPAELQAWLDGEVAGGRFGAANAALLEALRRVAEAERAAATVVADAGTDPADVRLADLRAAIQAGVASGNAGALDMGAIKRAGLSTVTRQRLGVAHGHFTVPESIDSSNHEVARLFNGP